MPEDAYFLNKI